MPNEQLTAYTSLEIFKTLEAMERVKNFFEQMQSEFSETEPTEIGIKNKFLQSINFIDSIQVSLLKNIAVLNQ